MTWSRTVVFTIGILVFFLLFFQASQNPIQRQFLELVREASLAPDLHPLEKLGKVNRLKQYFAEELTVVIVQDGRNNEVRRFNQRNFLDRAKSFYGSLANVTVSANVRSMGTPDQRRPILEAELRLRGRRLTEQEPFLEIIELKMVFAEFDNEWLIEEIEANRIDRGVSRE